MAFRSGKTKIHAESVAGIRGLAVKFVGSESVKRDLSTLKPRIQRRLLRQAVASAARPVAKLMRRYAKQSSTESDRNEGIGTTARSIDMKVGTSRKDPGVAYAFIGAKRGYVELVHLERKDRRSGVRKIVVGNRRGRTRLLGPGNKRRMHYRPLKNLGPVARKARLDPKSNTALKRVPTRYLHLIEKGTGRSRAYKFMRYAAHNGKADSRSKFAENIREGIVREFGKLGQL